MTFVKTCRIFVFVRLTVFCRRVKFNQRLNNKKYLDKKKVSIDMVDRLSNPFKLSELIETVNNIVDTTYDDSKVVHLSGAETITGAKTFTSNVKVSKTSPLVDLYNTNITKGTAPSSLQIGRNAMLDKDGKYIAMTQYQYLIDGRTEAILRAYNPNNETGYAQIGVAYKADGTVFTNCPKPTNTTQTDGTQIATTGWVNSVGNNIVHLTDDETITGKKIFTENLVYANTDITKGTNPSGNRWNSVELTDKNGAGTKNRVGVFESAIKTNGDIETLIGAYKYENNSTTVEKISVTYPKTGNPYTYAPKPTDTTETTTGTQIATTGWVNSVGNNVVHRTSNETVAGNKTFTSDPYIKNAAPQLYMDDSQQTKGTAPSTDVWGGITFNDSNGNVMGRCRQAYNNDKSNRIELQVHKANSSSDTDSATLGIKYPNSGSAYGWAPASSVNGSIVTTVNKSKSQNGYFKLGNGMIVQWGRFSNTNNNNITLTFPTPFTSTKYSINAMRTSVTSSGYSYDGITGVSSRANASCVLYSWYGNSDYDWIAIGY